MPNKNHWALHIRSQWRCILTQMDPVSLCKSVSAASPAITRGSLTEHTRRAQCAPPFLHDAADNSIVFTAPGSMRQFGFDGSISDLISSIDLARRGLWPRAKVLPWNRLRLGRLGCGHVSFVVRGIWTGTERSGTMRREEHFRRLNAKPRVSSMAFSAHWVCGNSTEFSALCQKYLPNVENCHTAPIRRHNLLIQQETNLHIIRNHTCLHFQVKPCET